MNVIEAGAENVNQLHGALAEGLGSLSKDQSVTFTQYTKYTFEQDGYVFWVSTSTPLTVKGSLHYSTDRDQAEDQTIGVNAVVFSAEAPVTEFNEIAVGSLWIGDWPTANGGTIKIAFSSRGPYYQQAGVFHYAGFTVYPALESQLVNSTLDLPAGPIVSNSLPIFLDAIATMPTQVGSLAPVVDAYNSFLVPENIVPPYVSVHVEPNMTRALQGFPQWTYSSSAVSSSQLMADHVSLTLYGLNNLQAQQFLAGLVNYSLLTDNFGFMNSPAIWDEKRTQSEIAALAMKKTIVIEASYYQTCADALARKLITSALVSLGWTADSRVIPAGSSTNVSS